MAYPLSSDVSSGQPTYASHYNNLRLDALTFGQPYVDSLKAGDFFARFAQNLNLSLSGTTRLMIAYDASYPAIVVIGSAMLMRTSHVYTPAGALAGLGAGTYYIIANRTAGSNSFTLTLEAAALDSAAARTIGTCYWDGTAIQYWTSYFGLTVGMNAPNYESAWFAVTTGTVYTKAHGLGVVPRLVVIVHSTSSSGASEQVTNFNMKLTAANTFYGGFGITTTTIVIETSTDAASGVCMSTRRNSAAGYYKIYAWL